MKKILKQLILFLLVFVLQSCEDKTKSTNKTNENIDSIKNYDSIKNADSIKNHDLGEEYNEPSESPAYIFPKTGNKAEDFITKPDIFEIQYEAEGDLNNDGLSDIVIVRKEKAGKSENRTMLVLLQSENKTYSLDKISELAMPIEYTESDYKIYDTEDITIEKGELSIHLYGTGPSGNLFSTFKYFGNELILTNIETYNMGAGSHQSLNYDPLKGELTQEVINTMEEDMPSKSKTFKLKKQKNLFEKTSPDDIIREVFKKIESMEW